MLRDYFCKIDNEGQRKTIIKDGKVIPVGLYHATNMGMRPGVHDLLIYYPVNSKAGLWIEMKRNMNYPPSAKKSTTWIAQEEFQKKVKSIGYDAYFCYGWEEGKRIIENYLLQ